MDGQLFENSNLPAVLDARVRSEMRDDERLLWVGQPRPGRFARQAIPMMLFGIPWTAFALFWMAAASGILFGGNGGNDGFGGNGVPGDNDGPGGLRLFSACFQLFGLPFMLIGFWMLSSPYWLWRQAKRTCYALTDRRAILWQAGKFGSVSVRSYGPEALGKTHRTEHADGCGDLVFEEAVTIGHNNDNNLTTTTIRHGFMAISNVREVEELLRRVLLPGPQGGDGQRQAEPGRSTT